MKKFLALMLSLALVFALAACGQKDTGDSNTGDSSNTDASADWPKANTRYIITASAGGGLDICARMRLLPTGRRQLTIKPSSR